MATRWEVEEFSEQLAQAASASAVLCWERTEHWYREHDESEVLDRSVCPGGGERGFLPVIVDTKSVNRPGLAVAARVVRGTTT